MSGGWRHRGHIEEEDEEDEEEEEGYRHALRICNS
jgi:hypothetical protein